MKFWQVLVLILIIATIGVGISIWQPWKTASRTIQVSAEGTIKAVPDVSKITAGVEVTKTTADEAQAEASKKVSAIIAVVKAKGVADKDIQTQSVSTSPRYDYSGSSQQLAGYTGTGIITVTVRDVAKAQDILNTVTASGATSVYGPQLTFSDEKLLEVQVKAQAEAVKNAKSKADNLAKASGAKVGKVVTITEADLSGKYYPMFDTASGAGAVSSAKPVDSIQAGENEVTVTVAVTYGLK